MVADRRVLAFLAFSSVMDTRIGFWDFAGLTDGWIYESRRHDREDTRIGDGALTSMNMILRSRWHDEDVFCLRLAEYRLARLDSWIPIIAMYMPLPR